MEANQMQTLTMNHLFIHESQNFSTPSSPQRFKFNPQLDELFLHDFYVDELDDLSFAFELFLSSSMKDVFMLLEAGYCKNWQIFRKVLHKIKPGIEAVGLIKMRDYIEELEVYNFEILPNCKIDDILNFLKCSFDNYHVLIREEKARLDYFLL